ncbi:MAG: polyprenyl diphosphate synthase [Bacilli bacterium]
MEKLKHVAIIVDGNGRWAQKRGKIRSEGHLEGSKMLERIIFHVSKTTDIEVLSAYIFSTENFKRDKKEVDYLMNLFTKWFEKSRKKYKDENIKIVFSGRKEPLSDKIYSKMKVLEEETKENTGLVVNFCLNYGGRAEIVDATKSIARKVKEGSIEIDDITEEYFSKNLYNNLPDVDLMIRTSGEERLSNFLLWQNSYAEFIFDETYFPDFNEERFDKCIKEYYERDRRFGGIKK